MGCLPNFGGGWAVNQTIPPDDRHRAVLDLDAFSHGMALLPLVEGVPAAAEAIRQALHAIGAAVHHLDRGSKLRTIEGARAAIGRAEAELLLPGRPGDEGLARALTSRPPAVSGLARWFAESPGSRR